MTECCTGFLIVRRNLYGFFVGLRDKSEYIKLG